MKKAAWLLAALAVAAGVVLVARRSQRPANVVIVTLDTFRPDHLGVEGYAGASTPNLDRFARSGARFQHCWTPAPITLPAHTSLMTGISPPAHGARDNGIYVVAPENVTLAELLASSGRRTAAFVSAFPLRRRYGLDQGFTTYDDELAMDRAPWTETKQRPKDFPVDERPADETTNAALAWLRQNGSEPFFLWVHYYDPHQPYEPPPPYRDLFVQRPYDGEIAFVDEQFGRLMAGLAALGLEDDTAIVVAADHSEGMGDHGEVTHAMLAYDGTMRVPLLMHLPGVTRPGQVLAEPVGLVDVVPTILDWAREKLPAGLEGRSVLPILRGDAVRPHPYYFVTEAGQNAFGWARLEGIRSGRWKLIHSVRDELFDVFADPGETRDLVRSEPARLAEMQTALTRQLGRMKPRAADTSRAIDLEARRQLEALGYTGTAAPPPARGESQEHPADHIQIINDWSRARDLIRQGNYIPAEELLLDLLAAEQDNNSVLIMLGTVYARTGRDDQAVATFERARRVRDVVALTELADAYGRLGQPKKSLELLEECSVLDPERRPVYLLAAAWLRRKLGDREGAFRDAREARELAPERAEPWWLLSTLHRDRRELGEAERALRRAAELDPLQARFRQNLASLYLETGRNREAVTEARAAVELAPDYPEGRYTLGMALARDRRQDEARKVLHELVGDYPHSAIAQRARALLSELDAAAAAR